MYCTFDNLVLSLHVISIVPLISQSSGFYFSINSKDELNANSSFIENLIMIYNETGVDLNRMFPFEFRVNFTEFNREFSLKFVRKKDNELGQSSGDVYVVDSTGNPVKYTQNYNEDFVHYTGINGQGIATLVRNFNNKSNRFRIVLTLQSNEAGDTALDIIPVTVRTRAVTRETASKGYDSANNYHVISRRQASDELFKFKTDYIKKDNRIYDAQRVLRDLRQRQRNKERSLLQNPVQLYIEYMLVTDLSIYNHHKDLLGIDDQHQVFLHMKIYFSHIINGVNERFANSLYDDPDLRLSVVLKNFLFLTKKEDCEWTDPERVGDAAYSVYNGRRVVLATPTLESFANYMNSKKFPFSFDHAVGFFNHDLWNDDDSQAPENRKGAVGFAFLENICTRFKYSIVEDIHGAFSNINAFAHELGHNLGLNHDSEEENTCSAEDNMVMTPQNSFFNILNSFKFSSCSVIQMKSTLLNDDISGASKLAKCLVNEPKKLPVETKLTKLVMPGMLWSLNDQCKLAHGANASFCLLKNVSVCATLFCRSNPNKDCTAYPGGAADGTTCGSGKGICVSHSLAPNDTCPFGDDLVPQRLVSIPFNDEHKMPCNKVFELIELNGHSISAYCSNEAFNYVCCQSCKKYKALKCFDKDIKCPLYQQNCEQGIFNDGQTVKDTCMRTCGQCQEKPIACSDQTFLCQNGATCQNTSISSFFGFKCICPPGWTGDLCEKKTPCNPSPCQNGGTCVPMGSLGYACLCTEACVGYNCSSCTVRIKFPVSTTRKLTTTSRITTTVPRQTTSTVIVVERTTPSTTLSTIQESVTNDTTPVTTTIVFDSESEEMESPTNVLTNPTSSITDSISYTTTTIWTTTTPTTTAIASITSTTETTTTITRITTLTVTKTTTTTITTITTPTTTTTAFNIPKITSTTTFFVTVTATPRTTTSTTSTTASMSTTTAPTTATSTIMFKIKTTTNTPTTIVTRKNILTTAKTTKLDSTSRVTTSTKTSHSTKITTTSTDHNNFNNLSKSKTTTLTTTSPKFSVSTLTTLTVDQYSHFFIENLTNTRWNHTNPLSKLTQGLQKNSNEEISSIIWISKLFSVLNRAPFLSSNALDLIFLYVAYFFLIFVTMFACFSVMFVLVLLMRLIKKRNHKVVNF